MQGGQSYGSIPFSKDSLANVASDGQDKVFFSISGHDSSSSHGDAFSPPASASNPRRSSSSSTTSSRPSLAEDIHAIRLSLEGASSVARCRCYKTFFSSSSPTLCRNKLECLFLTRFFQDSLMFSSKAWPF